MVEGLIGKKIGMTRGFDAEGNAFALTVLQAGPCTVIQKKGTAREGYEALQLGLVESRPVKRPNRAEQGHFQKSGSPVLRVLREFRSDGRSDIQEGDQVTVDIFQVGERVHVTGTSKGKGFQGVVTRHKFRGGRATHGSMFHRRPGSIGASSFPSRVLKGTRMAGRMGHARVTVKNLEVIETDKDNNLLVVKGAVPGPTGGYVIIKKGTFVLAGRQKEGKSAS